jgi:hypothetical protein
MSAGYQSIHRVKEAQQEEENEGVTARAAANEPLSVKSMKEENGEPDEVELDGRAITCEKGSDECMKLNQQAGRLEEFVV